MSIGNRIQIMSNKPFIKKGQLADALRTQRIALPKYISRFALHNCTTEMWYADLVEYSLAASSFLDTSHVIGQVKADQFLDMTEYFRNITSTYCACVVLAALQAN